MKNPAETRPAMQLRSHTALPHEFPFGCLPQQPLGKASDGALNAGVVTTRDEDAIVERNGFAIRLADTPHQHRMANALIERMYAWRGYRREGAPPAMTDVARTTLLVCREARSIGTLTLHIDSERGLLADGLYRREIDAYRRKGAHVCELTGFAFDLRAGSRELLAALFHLLYIAGHRLYRVSDVFIEVNPRHIGFYQSQLGFRQAGENRMCHRVEAPATLLHARIDYIEGQIARLAGKHWLNRRSLYPYFFAAPEEERLGRRLLEAKRAG